jgi:hypothetical protein
MPGRCVSYANAQDQTIAPKADTRPFSRGVPFTGCSVDSAACDTVTDAFEKIEPLVLVSGRSGSRRLWTRLKRRGPRLSETLVLSADHPKTQHWLGHGLRRRIDCASADTGGKTRQVAVNGLPKNTSVECTVELKNRQFEPAR